MPFKKLCNKKNKEYTQYLGGVAGEIWRLIYNQSDPYAILV
jgi:hypothetical protein